MPHKSVGISIRDRTAPDRLGQFRQHSILIECSGTLYGFTSEQVPIKGTIELEIVFKESSGVKCIPVLYTVVDVEASYNIIMGRLALNKLGLVVSTYHILKIRSHPPISEGTVVNVLDLDLDPRCRYEHERPHPAEDLKEIQVRPSPTHKTKIGTTLDPVEEARLVEFLRRNNDVFARTTNDMSGIDLRFMCHHLSIARDTKPVAQKKCKQGEEKQKVARNETNKLPAVGFIREVQYPTWLANVVMVKKVNSKWRICTDYTDLDKACPRIRTPLPSIDRLVDGVSGFGLLSFMDAYSGYNQI
ncbi:hypothetical protein CR513_35907, partial [Mucuna pruriens]